MWNKIMHCIVYELWHIINIAKCCPSLSFFAILSSLSLPRCPYLPFLAILSSLSLPRCPYFPFLAILYSLSLPRCPCLPFLVVQCPYLSFLDLSKDFSRHPFLAVLTFPSFPFLAYGPKRALHRPLISIW